MSYFWQKKTLVNLGQKTSNKCLIWVTLASKNIQLAKKTSNFGQKNMISGRKFYSIVALIFCSFFLEKRRGTEFMKCFATRQKNREIFLAWNRIFLANIRRVPAKFNIIAGQSQPHLALFDVFRAKFFCFCPKITHFMIDFDGFLFLLNKKNDKIKKRE